MSLGEERVGEEFVSEGDFFAEEMFGPEGDPPVLVGGGIDGRDGSSSGGGCGFGLAGDFGVDFFGGFAEGNFDAALDLQR